MSEPTASERLEHAKKLVKRAAYMLYSAQSRGDSEWYGPQPHYDLADALREVIEVLEEKEKQL